MTTSEDRRTPSNETILFAIQDLKVRLYGEGNDDGDIPAIRKSVTALHEKDNNMQTQISTLQGEHNARKNICDTGSQSSTWASIVRAVAKSKVVSICLAVALVAAAIIIMVVKG